MFRLHVIKNDEISGIFKGSYKAGIYVTAHFTLLVLLRVAPVVALFWGINCPHMTSIFQIVTQIYIPKIPTNMTDVHTKS